MPVASHTRPRVAGAAKLNAELKADLKASKVFVAALLVCRAQLWSAECQVTKVVSSDARPRPTAQELKEERKELDADLEAIASDTSNPFLEFKVGDLVTCTGGVDGEGRLIGNAGRGVSWGSLAPSFRSSTLYQIH
jgi:hypothetical protein